MCLSAYSKGKSKVGRLEVVPSLQAVIKIKMLKQIKYKTWGTGFAMLGATNLFLRRNLIFSKGDFIRNTGVLSYLENHPQFYY
jgi:hypothetical protein